MKLIAHRGWCEGLEENSLAAFARAAADPRVAGVELDVRRAADGGALVVSHDPLVAEQPALTLEAALALLAPTRLELLVEIKEPGIAEDVADALAACGGADRALVFAFARIARSFPWKRPRRVRLGIIVEYPWQIAATVAEHAPDVLLTGWDARAWTRAAFRAWWSLLSLAALQRRHGIPAVVGVVQRQADLDWLARQHVHAAVADMDRLSTPTDRGRTET
jgi:hypothetical protein